MTQTPLCLGCKTARRAPRKYLCPGCWYTLQPAARTALNRRDPLAGQRLLELTRQLADKARLADVVISP